MPDTSDYLARIRDLAGAKDPIAAQAQSAALIAELIAGVSAERLGARPAPDKWSVAENSRAPGRGRDRDGMAVPPDG